MISMKHYRIASYGAGAIGLLIALVFASPASAYDRYRGCDYPPAAYGYGQGAHYGAHHRHHGYRNYHRSPVRSYYQHRPRQYVGPGYHGAPVYQGNAYGPNFGNAVGGAIGGLVGSRIGNGSGRSAATAAGAIAGYVIGGNLFSPRY